MNIPEFNGIILRNLSNYIVQQHVMRYIFASKFAKDKIVLDVACGSGYGSSYLARYAKEVFGLDLSIEAIEFARNNYKKENLLFLQGDATSLPFHDQSFDVVVSFETIEHIREYRKFLKEVKRVLKPGGLFICSTPNIRYTQHPRYHVKEFYPEEFFSLLEEYFKRVERYGQYISLATRLKDLLRPKVYGLVGKVLSSLPYGERIKNIPKKRAVTLPQINYEIYEIKNEYAILFRKNKVVPINGKSKFRLLRIMIAICEN